MIERAFGMVKCQWRILVIPAEYDLDVQVRIPATLCTIHNFIQMLNPDTFFMPEFQAHQLEHAAKDDEATVLGVLGEGPADAAERRRAEDRQNHIAEEMWQDYCCETREQGIQLP